jgi:hypothetical protein
MNKAAAGQVFEEDVRAIEIDRGVRRVRGVTRAFQSRSAFSARGT